MPGRLAAWMRARGGHRRPPDAGMAQILTEPPPAAPAVEVPSLRCVLLVGDVLTRLDVGAPPPRWRRASTCVNLYGSHRDPARRRLPRGRREAGGRASAGRSCRSAAACATCSSWCSTAPARLAGIGEVGEICDAQPPPRRAATWATRR